MKKILFLLIIVSAFIVGCSEKDIPVFEGKNQVYFEKFYRDELHPAKGKADSTVISTFNYPNGTKEITAQVVVCLSGKSLEADTEFLVKVDEEETTADPSEYSLEEKYVFHARKNQEGIGEVTDTIQFKLIVSDRLASLKNGVNLVLKLEANASFDLGHFEKTKAKIHLTTDQVKPEWWDSEVESNLLGQYSVKKYKLFLTHSDTRSKMSRKLIEDHPAEAIELALKFKNWLTENPQYEENGDLMTVTI